jgi:hypothetical protein
LFAELEIEGVMLGEDEGKNGSLETYAHARACADLFKANSDRIDGILVSLPNFGDEKAVADAIKLSGLRVPVLVQAYPDDLEAFNVEFRRDAFCGKISVCNNLRQYGFDYTLTQTHTSPLSDSRRTWPIPGVPGGEGACATRAWGERRPPERLQHRPLQRKLPRPTGSPPPTFQMQASPPSLDDLRGR